MPNELPAWTEANLCKVISDLYTRAVNDQTLHEQLTADPFSVLSQHIQLPAEYQRNVFSKPEGNPSIVLNVPAYRGEAQADTPTAPVQAAYNIYCTVVPW